MQTRAAAVETRRVAAAGGARRAAKANTVLAALQSGSMATLKTMAAEGGPERATFARGLAVDASGRDRALAQLASLARRLPAKAQVGVARTVAVLCTGSQDEATRLNAIVDAPAVPADAGRWVQLALDRIIRGMAQAQAHLAAVRALVPEQARAHVEAALSQVNDAMLVVSGIGLKRHEPSSPGAGRPSP